jgi:GNAT superfamily N-acetyltransferase
MPFQRLWPGDEARMARHFQRLDPESRRFRFGRAVDDEALARYCAGTDWMGAIILGFVPDGELRGLGELRRLPGDGWRTAEFAVTVETPWRRRGLGSAFLRRLLALARNRGVETVCMLCLPDNRPLQRMARRLEAELEVGWGQVEGRIALRPADLASHLAEAWEALLPAAAAARPLSRA